MAEATIDPVLAELSPMRADLGMILARSAQRFGSKRALIAGGRTLTYRALHELCDRVAGGLHALGVRPGDRVSVYSPNRWEWVVAYHAALRAGAVVNPLRGAAGLPALHLRRAGRLVNRAMVAAQFTRDLLRREHHQAHGFLVR